MSTDLILNVADREAVRDIRTHLLENAGFPVKESATAAEALAMIAAEPFSLVLLDVNLPDMSGYELCRRLKANPDTALIPVLHIASAQNNGAAQLASLEAGADACLGDQVDKDILVATTRALLRVRQMHQTLRAELERRTKAEDALRSMNRRLRLLSESAADLLSQDVPPEEFIRDLFEKFASELGLEVYFHFQVGEGDKLRLRAWGGVPAELAREIEWLDYGQAVCGTVALERRPIIAEDVQHSEDPLTNLIRSFGITAYACHPLIANGRLFGTLSFGTRHRPRFEADEVDLLHTLCDQVAAAFERRRLREDVVFQASLLDQVHNAVIATDPEGKIVYWNRAAESMYQWTAPEVIGKSIMDVTVPHEGYVEASRILDTVAKTGRSDMEFYVKRKDQSVFPAFVSNAAIQSASGSVMGYVGVSIDISGQKRAEEILRQSEEKYRRIVETTTEGVWIVNAEGNTAFVNQRMATMLDYSIDEMLSIPALDMVFEQDHSIVASQFSSRLEGATGDYELRLRRKDGSPIWTHIAAAAMQDESGNFTGALRMVTDITDRKLAQQQIEEGQRKFRGLVDANVIGVIAADREHIIDANDVFLEMLGYTREDLFAGRLRWQEMTPPEYLPLDMHGIDQLLETGACTPFEKEYWHKDGRRVPILIGAALYSEKPEWLCFVLDMTTRKKAELAVQRSNEELKQFAYAISHDLQEPLRTIRTSTELLARVCDERQMSGDSRQLMSWIVERTDQMQVMIRDLLAYSSLAEPAHAFTTVDLNTALQLALANLQAAIDSSGAVVTHDPLPDVYGDFGRLTQVLQNLVGNAIKYCKQEPRVHISSKEQARSIAVSVADNGIGIEPKYSDRIFGVFKRLHGKEYPGTGIGLSMCMRIVEQHGGRIWVESKPGEGSTFFVELLKAEAAVEKEQRATG